MFATAVKQHPAATLVAMCEPVPSVREHNARTLEIDVYETLDAMFTAHPELTAAIVATPDFAHRDPAVTCLDNGLDLLIEKPLATTTTDARAIIDAALKSDTMVMVGFENRWNKKFAEVKRLLAEGARGRIVNQVANLNDTIFVPTKMLSWAARSSPAWFLMPHTLDLAMWLSESVPVDVFARGTRRLLPERGVDTWDAINASFRMSDGSIVSLNSQWVLPETSPSVFDFRYELHTDTSSFFLDISNSGVTRNDPTGVSWLQFGAYEHHGELRGIPIDMANDFIAVLNGDSRPVPDAEHGYCVTAAIEALHRSLESGRNHSIRQPSQLSRRGAQ